MTIDSGAEKVPQTARQQAAVHPLQHLIQIGKRHGAADHAAVVFGEQDHLGIDTGFSSIANWPISASVGGTKPQLSVHAAR